MDLVGWHFLDFMNEVTLPEEKGFEEVLSTATYLMRG
jgi:hypothetical protein